MQGSIIIKNVTDQTYEIDEMDGVEIEPGGQLNIMDESLPSYYKDYDAANRLVTSLETAKLYQDIQSGDIEIVSNTPPVLLGTMELPEG